MTPIEEIINDLQVFKDNYNTMTNQAHQELTDMETCILASMFENKIPQDVGDELRRKIKSLRIILP